jgi:hypothetical protein
LMLLSEKEEKQRATPDDFHPRNSRVPLRGSFFDQ